MENPPIPFVGPIHGGFSDGKMVRIQGYTAPIAERFNVNLQAGPEESDDIALHVSVRLTEGYVARNSFKGGEWGDEQGDGDLPIGPSQKFEIIVLCTNNDYKVAINGRHFCEFPQRLAPSSVTHLAINGDISLSLISFEGGENRSSASSQESSRQYGPQQTQYGPPGQFGSQGQYGPPQGQYGPPQGGQYGPPQGGPYGGYGAPPPPPGQQEKDGGFDFLGTASSVIAGAISSGMADKLIGSLTSGGNNQQPQHPQYQQQYHQNPPQQQQQPNFGIPQLGGQGSLGGLGSVGSLLSGFAEQILQPKKEGHH